MEIYKGASAFAGIAIGKIRFYRKGEYQIRQHQADDVKKELKNFDVARRHVMQTLKEEYDRMSEKQMDTADPELDMEPQPLDRIVKVNGENGTKPDPGAGRASGLWQLSPCGTEYDHRGKGDCCLCSADHKR